MSRVVHKLKRSYYKFGSPDFPEKHKGWNWVVLCEESLDKIGSLATQKTDNVTCKRCLKKIKKKEVRGE